MDRLAPRDRSCGGCGTAGWSCWSEMGHSSLLTTAIHFPSFPRSSVGMPSWTLCVLWGRAAGRATRSVERPVGRVARPAIVAQLGRGHHPGAERVAFDVAEHAQQVGIVLDDRAAEPPLPDVADASMPLVMPPGLDDGERLEDAA